MSDEARVWLEYAQENQQVAGLAYEAGIFNACLQNIQQAVEKALKAMRLSQGLGLKRTHSIGELRSDLMRIGVETGLEEEECELLDSIYLPSKYPLGSALPDYTPDQTTTRKCLDIAEKVLVAAEKVISQK